jgi:hypothetical protein
VIGSPFNIKHMEKYINIRELTEYLQAHTQAQAAKHFGVTVQTIATRIRKHQIQFPEKRGLHNKKPIRPIIPEGDYFLVPLGDGSYAKICACHKHVAEGRNWQVAAYKYAVVTVNGKPVKMHHLVAGVRDGFVIDHINIDSRDNRCSNLRHVTQQVNCLNIVRENRNNRSGYRGVSWHYTVKKWRAVTDIGGSRIVSYHETPELASQAYLATKEILISQQSTNR